MALEERKVLQSVEVQHQTKTLQVLWYDQIVRNGEILSQNNVRKAYCCAQRAEFEVDLPELAAKYIQLLEW